MKTNLPQMDCKTCESRGAGVFGCLAVQDLETYLSAKSCERLEKRDILFSEGDPADAVFCVRSGRFKVSREVVDQRRQIIDVAGPGEVLGYHSLLSGRNFSFTAEALEDADVCRISREHFLAMVQHNPIFARTILDHLSNAFEAAALKACSLGQKSVRERMAETLLLLGKTHGKKIGQEKIKIDVALSRVEIAQMAGTVLETAVRFLTEFKQDGLIELKTKDITLTNVTGLLKISGIKF